MKTYIAYGEKGVNVHEHGKPELQRVFSVAVIGRLVQRERKRQGITQAVAAGPCGVSVHFLSTLERGKETSEFSKVLQVCLSHGSYNEAFAAPGVQGVLRHDPSYGHITLPR